MMAPADPRRQVARPFRPGRLQPSGPQL